MEEQQVEQVKVESAVGDVLYTGWRTRGYQCFFKRRVSDWEHRGNQWTKTGEWKKLNYKQPRIDAFNSRERIIA